MDVWDEVVEKAINAEVKTSFQLFSRIREIDSNCLKRYRSLVKKDKDNAYRKQCNKASNKDKKKAKSHNPLSSANKS